MANTPITESQGEEIIDLLRDILAEIREIGRRVSSVEDSNRTLNSIERELSNLSGVVERLG